MRKLNKFDILNVRISAIDMDDACSLIEDRIVSRQKGYVCVCPVSVIMECRKDGRVLKSVNCADLATPDGMPVVWIGKSKGYKNIRRVYGPDLMDRMCDISGKKGYKNYLYGSSEDVLERLSKRLTGIYPSLIISGSYSPPYRKLTKEEDNKIIENINKTNSDLLWVGLGSPKQDLWMYEHREKINTPMMLGVGAAFDFLAGTKPQAPVWMRNIGFEWLFRLITEPKRLWRRYIIDSSLFIWHLFIELINPQLKEKSN